MYNPVSVKNEISDAVTAVFVCPSCGKQYEITVSKTQFDDYYIKNIQAQISFRGLPAEQREFFISGLCKECQEEIFG